MLGLEGSYAGVKRYIALDGLALSVSASTRPGAMEMGAHAKHAR